MLVGEPISSSWKARLELGFSSDEGRSVLARKRFEGPLVVQKPLYPEGGEVCHAIVVHPPAGIAGGDELEIDLEVQDSSKALLTTPGATRWYRSNGTQAVQRLRLDVRGDLEWLPQETIVFDGALAQMDCSVELGRAGRYIGWEILCLGRTGSGERFASGRLALDTAVRREGRLVFRERGAIEAGGRLMSSPVGLRGRTVCATMIVAAHEVSTALVTACRAVEGMAVTLLPGVLVARHLGSSSETAKALCQRLWTIVRPALFGRAAVEPRIWKT